MKAVVLARGVGRRMQESGGADGLTAPQREAAGAGAKGMMPVGPGGRPLLDFGLSALADAGVDRVCLVVAPDAAAIREYYDGPGRPARIGVSYAVQPDADGTARALLTAEAFAGADPFLVLNSDNVYPVSALRALAALDGPGLVAFDRDALVSDSGFPPERVAAFAVLDAPDGRLRGIIEKPGADELRARGPRVRISMNLWRFDARIFEACREVPASIRGEHELPQAVALAAARGVPFTVVDGWGPVLDLSTRADVAEVGRRLAGVEPAP